MGESFCVFELHGGVVFLSSAEVVVVSTLKPPIQAPDGWAAAVRPAKVVVAYPLVSRKPCPYRPKRPRFGEAWRAIRGLLLKLRKVELVGFKSFCEKTHLTFSGAGLSCIIGPNGCGKSNIVDAISWVLGEQSHKTLRAERMADCIFNGTAKRPPMGLAEVTLTLVDTELADAARRVLGDTAPALSTDAATETTETLSPFIDAAESTDNAPIEIESGPSDVAADKPCRKTRAAQKSAPQSRPGEVGVGRPPYRSVQTEYLTNGRTARVHDIQELFIGIGLVPE